MSDWALDFIYRADREMFKRTLRIGEDCIIPGLDVTVIRIPQVSYVNVLIKWCRVGTSPYVKAGRRVK